MDTTSFMFSLASFMWRSLANISFAEPSIVDPHERTIEMRYLVTFIKTAALCAAVLAMATAARADEADAKKLFKAMSDYLAAQKNLSLDFDSSLEIVTKDDQKIALASSGSVTLQR